MTIEPAEPAVLPDTASLTSSETEDAKEELRAILRSHRRSRHRHGEHGHNAVCRAFTDHALQALDGARAVAAYVSVGHEPCTRQLLDRLAERDIAVLLPVLGPHLAAAAQEMPLQPDDARWFGPGMAALADQLASAGLLRRRRTGWFWPRPERAVDAIDLRGLEGGPLDIVETESGRVLGQVDLEAADRSVFPGAVYLQQGEQYVVDRFAPERREALVRRQRPGYHTQPLSTTQARILHEDAGRRFGATQVRTGDVELVTQVIGYLRRDERTGQVWDENPLELDEHRMVTKAVWWTVPQEVADRLGLSAVRLGSAAHAVEHTAIGLLPAFAPCDRWDIGGVSMVMHPDTELCTIIVHDGVAGGAGFAARGYEMADEWGRATLERLRTCACFDGCPACVVSPKCGNANQHLDKEAAAQLLAALIGD